MSYSICVSCKNMVPCYEKYCATCVRKYGVKQDEEFHKRHCLPIEDFAKEFEKDRKEVRKP